MGEAKRKKTIGEHLELKPGEPVALKFFGAHDVLELMCKGPSSLDEEAWERVCALRTVMRHATSGKPPHCVLCDAPTAFPGLIAYARAASKTPGGAVFVICQPCAAASEDLRGDILAALGEKELETSSWPS
jgi:hypothetical protein